MTQEGIDKAERQLGRIERDLPRAAEEVKRTGENGDFSENFEYQEAKAKLRRMLHKQLVLKDRLSRVVLIETNDSGGPAQLGSKVLVEVGGEKKEFEILGPHESDPMQGRISNKSPLGMALVGRMAGDEVEVGVKRKKLYKVIRVK